MHDRPTWRTAPPLWGDALAGRVPLERPALLRFDRDDFVDQLQRELDDPQREVGEFLLQPETWRQPAHGLAAATATTEVPRLYQPVHARFYLVTAGLVCERYGLPDKNIHPACDESAFAVLRRLEPTGPDPVELTQTSSFRELGWVPQGDRGTWLQVSAGLVPGEDRLASFPMSYTDGHRRRVLAAMVPVAARERYEAAVPVAPVSSEDPAAVLALPGRARFEGVVLALQSVVRLAGQPTMVDGDERTRDGLRVAFFFALVDLATFLAEELHDVWEPPLTPLKDAAADLSAMLAKPALGATWRQVLIRAYDERDGVVHGSGAPPAPVGRATLGQVTDALDELGVNATVPPLEDPVFAAVSAALDERVVSKTSSSPSSSAGPMSSSSSGSSGASPRAGAVYAVRFVYERPRCLEAQRLTFSALSPFFRLAHFHDPDAPFRDNKIVLPVDTSLAGLRAYPKAVRMEVSAQLRKQMERIQAIKLKDLDDGTIPDEPALDLGMVCQLSIPIITICALVLLMIIVSLLNLVFFWVPLFKICLPKAP